ncbi:T9SS type A sorting domain-containing protein [Aquimarina sp. U1-2]|uniref:CBM96 family carbohydrate-binding protein n=1 Tax=Aquimarina sp. U1-2 TaxID=2823141 RepID=UPI001AED0AF1|nr:T9SS type A sorting domain-containing protein [Aquimarina sp. U1-2]MBP2833219.1 T9SS type A sorting domain-containing protein [Aquimarina sp. U1-2]
MKNLIERKITFLGKFRYILTVFFLISFSLQAKTIYVSTSGSDSNAGTRNQPVRTLNRAKELCRLSNDSEFIILLRGGDTFRNFTQNTSSVLYDKDEERHLFAFVWDINKKLIISTYGNGKAKLIGDKYKHQGGPPSCIGISKPSSKQVIIENLHIEEWQVNAITMLETQNITMRNCVINKIGQIYFPNEKDRNRMYVAGVIYPQKSQNLLFENLIITNCHNRYDEAGSLHAFYNTRVRNSTFRKIYMRNISGSPLKWRRLYDNKHANNSVMDELYCYYTGQSSQWDGPRNNYQPGFLRYSGDKNQPQNCPRGLEIKNSVYWYPYCNTGENCNRISTVKCTVAHSSCGRACTNDSQIKWSNNSFRLEWKQDNNIPTPQELGIGEPETNIPSTPRNFNAAAQSSSEVLMTWTDASNNEKGFKIERGRNTSNYTTIATVNANTTSYRDTGLTAGTKYFYRIKAFNNEGDSNYVADTSTTDEETGGNPTNFIERDGVLSMEAENGKLGRYWQTHSNASASGNLYIQISEAYNQYGDVPTDTSVGAVTSYDFTSVSEDNFRFWFRTLNVGDTDDSFFWRIDDGTWIRENGRSGVGSWHATDNSAVDNLSQGQHTLQIAYRENGMRLDKFVIQLDNKRAPSGNGPEETTNADTSPQTIRVTPIDDAYLQGNTRYNTTDLRIEAGNRVSYLLFDVGNLNGSIDSAELKLSVGSDPGHGQIRVYLGTSVNWTERNLSNSNKPSKGRLLATKNTSYTTNKFYTWNLDGLATSGKICLIVEHTSGNDVSFWSKEGAKKPELTVTTRANRQAREFTSNEAKEIHVSMHPNPANDVVFLQKLPATAYRVEVYSFNGYKVISKPIVKKQSTVEVNLDKLPTGIYFVKIYSKDSNTLSTRLLKN